MLVRSPDSRNERRPADSSIWVHGTVSVPPSCKSAAERSDRGHTARRGDQVTATLPSEPNVLEANENELREAVHRALEYSGYSFAELAEQARSGNFASLRARMAWAAIGDLEGLAD